MNYVGIDVHKRYSVCAAQDEQGRELGVVRIEGNTRSGFAQFLDRLGGPARVAIEACWNWGKIYEVLEELPQVSELVVGNPLKTRLIGEAQIKTDKIDARALATLLRGHFIAPGTRAREGDAATQGSAAPAAILVAFAHTHPQPYSCLTGSAA